MRFLQTFVLMATMCAFGFTSPSASANDEIGESEATLVMVASYFGAAFYCTGYGVDYRSLSEEVNDGMLANVIKDDDLMWLLWNRGYEAGKRGMLYSIENRMFFELKDAPDTQQACDYAYRNAVAIANMR